MRETKYKVQAKSDQEIPESLAKQMKTFASSSATVDHHLADQLLLPMALAKGGVFATLRPSLHTTTHSEVIRGFTGRSASFEPDENKTICQKV